MVTNYIGDDYMDNYNTRTIGILLKDYFSETGDSLETFSKNTGISVGFIKQLLEDRRHPSTDPKNTTIINKISDYTGDSFEDVYNATVETKRKIDEENARNWEKGAPKRLEEERKIWELEELRLELERQREEQRKVRELEQKAYAESLVTKKGYEITVLKEKEPIKIYGDYEMVKVGECSFIKHDGCLYGVSYITKIKEFDFMVDDENNIVTDRDIFFFNNRKPLNIR